ncbi:MAG: hypothetical protein HY564_00605, partial [Candidatus Jacksonbacteria bacterium]|nr:hypothetical protein [Candidatus Jacksonbacteria bacterium]
YVPLARTIASFKEILEGKLDDTPESAFYMAGDIEEVRHKTQPRKLSGSNLKTTT